MVKIDFNLLHNQMVELTLWDRLRHSRYSFVPVSELKAFKYWNVYMEDKLTLQKLYIPAFVTLLTIYKQKYFTYFYFRYCCFQLGKSSSQIYIHRIIHICTQICIHRIIHIYAHNFICILTKSCAQTHDDCNLILSNVITWSIFRYLQCGCGFLILLGSYIVLHRCGNIVVFFFSNC